MGDLKDMTGLRFGRLSVIERSPANNKEGQAQWVCVCDCGEVRTVPGGNLRTGNTESCGCKWLEIIRLLPGEAALNSLYYHLQYRAENRGLDWNIAKEELRDITSRPCFYCGTLPALIARGRNGNYVYNGLDRVNSQEGYIINNVVPCCKQCNIAKLDYSVDEFLSWIERVHRHQG